MTATSSPSDRLYLSQKVVIKACLGLHKPSGTTFITVNPNHKKKSPASLQEEFEAVMLPRHRQKRGLVARHSGGKPHAEVPYKRLAPKGTLPGAVDWRGSLAESVVKDQAACGSCWSFAATGALEAAHLLATGERRLAVST